MKTSLIIAAGALFLSAGVASANPLYGGLGENNCTVDKAELQSWFSSGAITANGTVKPADSVTFDDATLCNFYKWGEQMFMWLTSPQGQNGWVFDGPLFHDVVADGSNFVLVPNDGTTKNRFALRSRKNDQVDSTGQAGGSGVLITQSGDLTYYGINVNDVYVAYLNQTAIGIYDSATSDAGKELQNNFPFNKDTLDLVVKNSPDPLPDQIALSLELKTSWVPIDAVSDSSRYVTITADVPDYKKVSDTLWELQPDPVSKDLALVGMHVTGTVNGHPEMVWASFEHLDNAPDNSFYLAAPDGTLVPVPFRPDNEWLFRQSGGDPETHIVEIANSKTGNIESSGTDPIGPNEVTRLNPFGNLPGADPKAAANNTQLLGLAVSVNSLLPSGDVRANYFQLGSVWTSDGSIPPDGKDADGELRGSLYLANATMETFHQYPDQNNNFISENCFTCHGGTVDEGVTTSHIFQGLLNGLK